MSINQRYFSEAVCAIVVYDVTDRSSLSKATTWLAMVDQFCPENTLKVLVGNKIDLYQDRNVSRQDAERFVQENSIDLHFEVSAKAGTGIREMIHEVSQTISDRASIMREILDEDYKQFQLEANEQDIKR